MLCKIGPIEIDRPYTYDDGDVNNFPLSIEKYLSPGRRIITSSIQDKEEGFSVKCDKFTAKQVVGLAGQGDLQWVDGSILVDSRDGIPHRGWTYLGECSLEQYPTHLAKLNIAVEILAQDENQILLMDYLKGDYDQLLVGYDEDAREYLVQDTFASFSNLIWTDAESYRMSDQLIYPSSGTLYLQGKKASGNSGSMFTQAKSTLPAKCTIETGIDFNVGYTPTVNSTIYLYIVLTTNPDFNSFVSDSGLALPDWSDTIIIAAGCYINGGAKSYSYHMIHADEEGHLHNLCGTTFVSAGEYDFKIELGEDGYLKLYCDDVEKYAGPSGLSTVEEGLYTGMVFHIIDSATPSATYYMKSTYFDVYTDRTFPEQVLLPPNSIPVGTPDDYRQTMWGDLPLFENPTEDVKFQVDPDDYDKGSPKAYINESEGEDFRRIFNQEESIDLGSMRKIVYNNLVDPNVALCTSVLNSATGFVGSSGELIISSIEWTLEDLKRSLKIITNGGSVYETAYIYPRPAATAGKEYVSKITVGGDSGALKARLVFLNSAGDATQVIYNDDIINLDGTAQSRVITGTAPANTVSVRIEAVTNGTMAIPFYYGEIILLEGSEIPDYDYLDPETGDLVKEVKSKSNQFYVENGIIKVEPTHNSVRVYAFESLLTENQRKVSNGLTGITSYSSNNQHSLYRDTSIFKIGGGSAALKSNYDGSQGMALIVRHSYTDRFLVNPDETYYFTAIQLIAKLESSKTLYLHIRWFDSDSNPLTGSDVYTSKNLGDLDNLEWFSHLEEEINPPDNAASCYFEFYCPNFLNNEILWYDSCQFGKWTLKEEIPLGDNEPITNIQIKEINRGLITLQINNTLWTVRNGDPVVRVQHPTTPLGIKPESCYIHDSTTTINPDEDDDITMGEQHFLLKWNSGENLEDTYKWADTVKANNGKIYGIPDQATDIIILDPSTGEAKRDPMGLSLTKPPTDYSRWLGGVLANNGKIYCIPFDTNTILIIDPINGYATLSTMGADLSGSNKWYGGVLGNDGKIYGIPYDATDILIIDPSTGTATRSAMGASLSGLSKWAGGAKLGNGKIYGIPSNSTDILVINTGTNTASRTSFGQDLSGTNKWIGGVLSPAGDIYAIPNDATDVLIIVSGGVTATRSNCNTSPLTGGDKWCRGVLYGTKIYGIPSSASDILVIETSGSPTASRSAMGADLSGAYKWFGGALASDNKIYCIPEDAKDFLEITPGASPTAERDRFGLGICSNPVEPQQKRIMIVQTTPTTIKANLIPAASETGIGVYDKDEEATGKSGYITLAGWFVNRGRQKMKLP